jgi:cytosine/adenosine deaminase-related metal-dependent hydrolase
MPPASEFVLRDAEILSFDPAIGDIHGSIHVKDGRIAAVAPSVEAPGAREVDARDTIIMPGLVDTHWHMWQTLLRGVVGDAPDRGFFQTIRSWSHAFTAEDMATSIGLAAREAIETGITTVHDWNHNIRAAEYADASMEALRGAGLRARFSFGYAIDRPVLDRSLARKLDQLLSSWNSFSGNGRITLGFAWRGIPVTGDPGVAMDELKLARSMGLPVSVHIGSIARATRGEVLAYRARSALGPEMNVVHATEATDQDVAALRDAGCSVTVLPWSEMLAGWGEPSIDRLSAAGIPVGLGVDSTLVTGTPDLFAAAKLALGVTNLRRSSEHGLLDRQALELVTLGGARVLGLDDQIGSVSVGKRADLVVLRPSPVDRVLGTGVYRSLLRNTTADRVRDVIVDGVFLKKNGELTASADRLLQDAGRSLRALRARC